jgi:hypothetical protein
MNHGTQIAAILSAVSLLAACGGGEDTRSVDQSLTALAAPLPVASALKATRYSMFKHDDGQPFGIHDAGEVTSPTPTGGRLGLGSVDGTDLTVVDASSFAVVASNKDFRVFARLRGSVLMLCDPGGLPGSSTGRYAAVADTVAAGGSAASRVLNATELAGRTFYEVTDCSYRSGDGSQNQDLAHNDLTNTLSVATNGDMSVSRMGSVASRLVAEDFTSMLHGVWFNGPRYSAFKFDIAGVTSYVLIQRASPDEIDRRNGAVTIWLPD